MRTPKESCPSGLVPKLQHPFPGSPPQITRQSPVAGDDKALYFLYNNERIDRKAITA